jgi:hypothetical protein
LPFFSQSLPVQVVGGSSATLTGTFAAAVLMYDYAPYFFHAFRDPYTIRDAEYQFAGLGRGFISNGMDCALSHAGTGKAE